MPYDNLVSALKRSNVKTPAPIAGETPGELAEHAEGMDMSAEHAEKHALHMKMARKAGSPASRAVHKKLAAHYKAKLNG